jgi:hypothetical protein
MLALLLFAAAPGWLACSLLFPLADTTEGAGLEASVPTSDAGGADGFAADVAQQPDADASPLEGGGKKCALPNLLVNGDFESGTSNWFAGGSGVFATSGVARSGDRSAIRCGTDLHMNFQQNLPAPGGRFYMRAWVRSVPDAGAMKTVDLYVDTDVGLRILGSISPPPADWTCLEGGQTVAQLNAVWIESQALPATGLSCHLLDNVELFRVPDAGVPPECVCPIR